MNTGLKNKPDLSFAKLWNLSFGFFGVQIAYALQSANISRIFATLGADPHDLSYFWILPPLMGIIVQPLVGTFSDKTWCRFGRRIPYLFIGALVAVLVMCLLPNAGSFGMTVSTAMVFGLVALMFLDTSINMAMQPFYVFPFFFTFIGISNIAPKGVIPDSVIYSFYIGAAILILCVIYTSVKVKEMPPKEYAEYHGLSKPLNEDKVNWFKLLRDAPSAFWTVGLVQFFCWAAFLYMWNYTNGAIAETCWQTTDPTSEGFQAAGNWVGILFAVQAIGSVCWAVMLPRFKNRKAAYSLSLVLGAAGFLMVPYIHDQYVLFVPYLLIGCAWAAMLAMPFTIVTNALNGSHMGTYLGLFNGTICIPQIIAAALGGVVLSLVGSAQSSMMTVSGVLLVAGAASVFIIKETSGEGQ